jgi:hypothetical protein
VVRTLVLSLALHVALVAGLSRSRRPLGPARAPVELVVLPTRINVSSNPPPAADARVAPSEPRTRQSPRLRTAMSSPSRTSTRGPEPLAPASPRAIEAGPGAPTPRDLPAAPPRVDLFARTALAAAALSDHAADSPADVAPSAAARAWRPRHGVGGVDAAGGVDVGSFLAEDAARQRVAKGAVLPELRRLERRLDDAFVPTFTQADISNRAELFIKQMRGFLRNPPKTGELARGIDPAKETYAEKLRSMRPEQVFFLGRRVEVYVRQKPDGSIIEMAVRNPSGYRGYDDAALAAVESALGGHLPAGTGHQASEVRTLWQLDATAYVVISPNPVLEFDESSGKSQWIYPLQKRVDHHVRLVAVY